MASQVELVVTCAAARAFALSLLERETSAGVDGLTPSAHEVMRTSFV